MLEYNEYQYHDNAEMDELIYKFYCLGNAELFFVDSKFWLKHGKFKGKLNTDKWLTISEFNPQVSFLELNNLNVEAAIYELAQFLETRGNSSMCVIIVFPPFWDKFYFNNQLVNGLPGDYKVKVLFNNKEELIIDEGDVEKRKWKRKRPSRKNRKNCGTER